MSTLHPQTDLEDLLRESLTARAESVHPAGDGLSRIQHRITARRQRARWLGPTLAFGVVAALAATGIGAYAALRSPSGTQSVRVPPAKHPSGQPTPAPSVSATTAAPAFPARGIFPFVTRAQEQSWEAGGGANGPQPWVASPVQCALRFVTDMLGQPTVSAVTETALSADGRAATVTLGRSMKADAGPRVVGVTRVRLARFSAAWEVLGADDAGTAMTVTSPAPAGNVDSPLVVTGPGFGVDEAVTVELRSVHARGPIGKPAHASFGQGTPTWSATLSFAAPSDAAGAIVVTDVSAADGGPGRIVVVPVRFGGPAGYPARFVAVKNARVTLFASRNGAALKYLTGTTATGAPSDPHVAGGTVYYLAPSARCGTTVMSVPMTGGQSAPVVAADDGYRIGSYAVSRDGSKVALFEESCGRASPQGRLVTRDLTTGARTVLESYQSFPPIVVGDPSWEPDSQHLDLFTRSGMTGAFARYDTSAPTSPNPVCGDRGPLPFAALDVDGSGALWFAEDTASAAEVYRCLDNHSSRMVTLRGVNVTDIAVSADGSSLLLTDDAGRLWRWSRGQTVPLTPSVRITHASWA